MKRTATVLITAGLASLSLTAPAHAASGGANNVVNIVNQSGTQLRAHEQLAFFGGDTSASTNLANALSSNCSGCHSRAVAVQEIVFTGSPSTFTPTNTAAAVNSNCTGCVTVAYAHQTLFQSSPGAHLTTAAADQAVALEAKIDAVAQDPAVNDVPYTVDTSGPHSELSDALDALCAQLDEVVRNGLVSAGSTLAGATSSRQVRA